MAYDEAVRSVTVVAGSAIAVYRLIALAADGEFDYVGTAGLMPDGVSLEAASGQGKVLGMGLPDGSIVKVVAGAAFSRGDNLMSNNAGKAIAFTNVAGQVSCGKAMAAAAADGDVVSVLFKPVTQYYAS